MPVFDDWTRVTWWVLHTYAAAFPSRPSEERRRSFEKLMNELAQNFPCSVCGVHMKEYLAKNPIYPQTESRDSLERYIYEFHEAVNKRKGKPQVHSFEEVKQAFSLSRPWKPFGNYPILPASQVANGEQKHDAKERNLKEQQVICGESNNMERVYIIIIIILSLLVLIIGAFFIYFVVRYKSIKNTTVET